MASKEKKSPDAMLVDAEQDGQALLDKAALLLARLDKQAEAARAEAERAELAFLFDEAKRGDEQPLREWFAARRESSGRFDSTCQPDSDGRSASSESLSLGSSTTTPSGLASTGSPTAEAASTSTATSAAQTNSQRDGWDASVIAGAKRRNAVRLAKWEQASGESDAKGSSGVRGKPSTALEAGVASPVASRKPIRADILAAVASVSPESNDGAEPKRRSKLAGVLASLTAHCVLIGLLALITMKIPSEAASMMLQSSVDDSPTDVVEITESVTPETPDASDEASIEPISSAADSLADIQDSLSDTLADLAPVQSSVVSAASAVSAAASASSVPTNTSASFFGAAASGNNFCYVIDASGSMRGGAWEAAKAELLRSLSTLSSKQRYYIIFFNRKLSLMTEPGTDDVAVSSLYAEQDSLAHTRRWIESIEIDIGAPPMKALEAAIELEPDAIYLLTDGVTQADVLSHLRKVNRVESLLGDQTVRVPIHAIAYYSLDGQALLRQIAQENNGQFVYVPDPRQ